MNLEVVWQTIYEDIPGFKIAIIRVLTEITNQKPAGRDRTYRAANSRRPPRHLLGMSEANDSVRLSGQ